MLGRDASSVFPTETNAQAVDVDAVKAALGSNTRFITESEVRPWYRSAADASPDKFVRQDSILTEPDA